MTMEATEGVPVAPDLPRPREDSAPRRAGDGRPAVAPEAAESGGRCGGRSARRRRTLCALAAFAAAAAVAGLAAGLGVALSSSSRRAAAPPPPPPPTPAPGTPPGSPTLTERGGGGGGGGTATGSAPPPPPGDGRTDPPTPSPSRPPRDGLTEPPTRPASWSRLGQDLQGDAGDDRLGGAVSLSDDGTVLAVAAPLSGGGSGVVSVGRVRVLSYDGAAGAWAPLGGPIDGESYNEQSGWGLSLSGDGAVVAIGSPLAGSEGLVRAFAYDAAAGDWVRRGQVVVGGESDMRSGASVSLSGDATVLAVGAPFSRGADDAGFAGRVRAYRYDGVSDRWNPMGQPIDGEAPNERMGMSVSLSAVGDVLAAGAPLSSGARDVVSVGRTRIFRFDDALDEWVPIGQAIDGTSYNDQSGSSVSLSADGTTVAIGAPLNDGLKDIESIGQVRIFWLNDGSDRWEQLGDDIYGDAYDDRSSAATSISCDGSIVAAGAPLNDGLEGVESVGQTRIFRYMAAEEAWVQMGDDIYGDAYDDRFGAAVSLSCDGDVVAVGAPLNDGVFNIESVGQARVYNFGSTNDK